MCVQTKKLMLIAIYLHTKIDYVDIRPHPKSLTLVLPLPAPNASNSQTVTGTDQAMMVHNGAKWRHNTDVHMHIKYLISV